MPILFSTLPNLFGHADWKYRHTALMILAIMAEGCKKYLDKYLDEIVKGLLNFARDPHPRVRWAFCNAVGQMATDFGVCFVLFFSFRLKNFFSHFANNSQLFKKNTTQVCYPPLY